MSKSKPEEEQALWDGGQDDEAYDGTIEFGSVAPAPPTHDAVTFKPSAGAVEFQQMPPDDGENGGPTRNQRLKWIVLALAIVAILLLITVPLCVYMVHLHPKISGQGQGLCEQVSCRNNGTCIAKGDDFRCVCVSGYSGALCDYEIDECASSPCSDGVGTCIDTLNGYRCECDEGFTGTHCEIDIDDCARSPCLDGAATCVDKVNNFTCQCIPGYTGRYCETNIDECASGDVKCVNGATCHDGVNGYYCQCDGGFTGKHCEADHDECASNPCHHKSLCIDGVNSYRCKCAHGYKGAHCDIEVDECSSSPCVNGATCINDVNKYYCKCDSGYTGKYCETDADACKSLPCFHGSTCITDVDGYICECPVGYTGKQCETDIDDCASSPCQHNGACVDSKGSYLCVCKIGYHGTHCENIIGSCPADFIPLHDFARCYLVEESDEEDYEDAQAACSRKNASLASLETTSEIHNVGLHFNEEGRYHILSARRSSADDLIYWNTGQLLPENHEKWSSGQPSVYDDCVAAIMRDDATKLYSMGCSYDRPYVCERTMDFPPGVNDCRIHPCMNGATCHNVTGGDFSCSCPVGFTGKYCTQDIDECLSDPCLNGGTCRDQINQYTCVCVAGYTGDLCQTNIDNCVSNPCHNRGTCVDGIEGYTCICPTNHTGTRCEAGPDDPCPMDFEFWNVQGQCYFVEERSSYEKDSEEAVRECVNRGANLVSFESAEELEFVGSLFRIEGRYHVTSGSRVGGDDFRWRTGVSLPESDHKWHSGQPSYEDCVAAIRSSTSTTLYTMSCTTSRPFVCEMAMLLPAGINDCRSMPCLNGATCADFKNNTYACTCPQGYVGQRCETDIDECILSRCQNGATCIDNRGGYECICPDGFTGTDCETDIDECASNPCESGGTCIDQLNGYKCACDANYTGYNCETGPDDPCYADWVFMSEVARCYLIKEDSSDEVSWQTAEQECQKRGATLASLETEEEVDFVGSHFQNTGRYHILSGRRELGDKIFWNTGEEILNSHPSWSSGNPDSSEDCVALIRSSGATSSKLHSMECYYERPYVCEMSMLLPPGTNACLSMPCRNGADCHTMENNTYYCNCTTGFRGQQCETDIDECQVSPCENGASCEDGRGWYKCRCTPGFTGLHCEINIDDCASFPCGNDSTCIDELQGYSCVCAVNYTGPNCETGPDDPCPHGFEFYEQQARCYFIEEDSTKQLNYEDATEVCRSKNSTLANLETSEEVDFVGNLFSWTGRYHVIGARRDIDDNLYWNNGRLLAPDFSKWKENEPSSYKDCVSAIMSDQHTTLYSIECSLARPYVCERSIRLPPGVHSCRSMPCIHGATCVEGNNDYTCRCPPGYMGTYCEIDFDECASHPCQNGATCQDGRGDYSCECLPGFTGDNCETDIDDCLDNPCANNGTCVDGTNAFTCVCEANFTGALCLAGAFDTCPQDFFMFPGYGKCYLIREDSSQQLSLDDAKDFCQGKESVLASFETKEEVDFVGSQFTWTGRYHMLNAYRTGDGGYQWGSGSALPSDHPSWHSGEPGSADCVSAIAEHGSTTLHGNSCNLERPFVCERDVIRDR